MFISEAFNDPFYYFSVVTVMVISVVAHELGHGFAALRLGDDTPRLLGHMTLDPAVHMGTTGLILLFVFGIAFGSMPVNPSRFRGRFGSALVAFAGPAVNLLLAALGLAVIAAWVALSGLPAPGTAENVFGFFRLLVLLNIILALFNLLPIPPLDGSTVLSDVAPGFRRFASNPNNKPIFFGAFIIVFVTAWRVLIPLASGILDHVTAFFA